jgi:small GTP-binding protein
MQFQLESLDHVQRFFKILVVGGINAGKTSFIRKYVDGYFSEFYKSTIGVDFASKNLIMEEGKLTFTLQFHDISGQERDGKVNHIFYKDAVFACIFFDMEQISSIDVTKEWKKDIDSNVLRSTNERMPCLLVGSKADLLRGKLDKDMNVYCNEEGYIGFFQTSAKTGQNIEESMKFLVDYLTRNNIKPETTSSGCVDLNHKKAEIKDKKKCCK